MSQEAEETVLFGYCASPCEASSLSFFLPVPTTSVFAYIVGILLLLLPLAKKGRTPLHNDCLGWFGLPHTLLVQLQSIIIISFLLLLHVILLYGCVCAAKRPRPVFSQKKRTCYKKPILNRSSQKSCSKLWYEKIEKYWRIPYIYKGIFAQGEK